MPSSSSKRKVSARVYLDNASTTPLSDEARAVLLKASKEIFGNPGSIHDEGVSARRAIHQARKEIGMVTKALPDEIIFTSGTTEANMLAIYGVVQNAKKNNPERIPHVVTTTFEHHAVLRPLAELEKWGVRVTQVEVAPNGIVDPRKISDALTDETILVSVMYAQNEIGTIQPIKEIAKVVRGFKNEALKRRVPAGEMLFHTDAAQAPGSLPLNVLELNVDLMSFGAHKFYGSKGVGILYKRRPVTLVAQIFGGSQERGLRAGTENVPSIIASAFAFTEAERLRNRETKRLIELRDYFFSELPKFVPPAIINGDMVNRLPNNINFSILGMDGEVVVLELDARGVSVSTGSACTTDELGPSHVLLAIGVEPKIALGSIRISMGRTTTKSDLKYVLKCLKEIIEKYKNVLK